MNRLRSAIPLWIVLLTGVLALHSYSRLSVQLARPLDQKHFYPSSYIVSLSLLSGGGFSYLLPVGVTADGSLPATIMRLRSETGAGGPVMDFLSGQGRETLSADEFRRYLDAGTQSVPIGASGSGTDSRWLRTRVLDLQVAAILWRVFGISWPVLFGFYALLSTAACLLVFCITARLTGSPWGGLLGALSLTVSPFERHVGAWSIRDASPLWFTCLAIFVLLKCAEPLSTARARTYLCWFMIGVSSLIGLGWRPDAYLLPPFMLISLVAMILAAKARFVQALLATALFVAGAITVWAMIDWLGPPSSEREDSAAFHIAWYADNARSNLLRTENVFQIRADDDLVLLQANYFRLQRHGDGRPSPEAYDSRHLSASRAMYLELARYHAYAWWKSYPAFLASMTKIDRALVPDPPIGGAKSPSPTQRGTWLERAREGCTHYYLVLMPFLFALGSVTGVLRRVSCVASLVLVGYFAYYAAVLLIVLPEAKHFSPLLLPLHVLSAAGAWFILCRVRFWRTGAPGLGRPWRVQAAGRLPLILACALILSWSILGLSAHRVSKTQRRRLVNSLMPLAAAGEQRAEATDSTKLHTVRVPASGPPPESGYLFAIRGAARRPTDLLCVHVRQAPPGRSLYYYSRHQIAPTRDQFFFVNPVAGRGIGEERSYRLHVRLRGGAKFLSVRRLDLSKWKIGLPLSLVFSIEDDLAGDTLPHDGRPITGLLLSPEGVEDLVALHQRRRAAERRKARRQSRDE